MDNRHIPLSPEAAYRAHLKRVRTERAEAEALQAAVNARPTPVHRAPRALAPRPEDTRDVCFQKVRSRLERNNPGQRIPWIHDGNIDQLLAQYEGKKKR